MQQSGHLHLGDPYTLQFNLEISRESMLDLLKYLTGKQILRYPTSSDTVEQEISSNALESQIASIIQEI